MIPTKTYQIALADDHILVRNALARLINAFDHCQVLHESNDGQELLDRLRAGQVPDILLLDLNMPRLNGYEVAERLQKDYPDVRVLMLTMYDSELALIRLLQLGVRGFLKKDVHPSELRSALYTVMDTGYYYSTSAAGKIANLFRTQQRDKKGLPNATLSDPEIRFLTLACSDLTYKEIAQEMRLTPRSVDVLRDQLFFKFDVRSRVGLAMLALKNGVITG
ncbi:MAG: response regulator transcription factor [Chitinophagaceae bacterium]|nr:MAG: response regulator transcription factor [Chitinophagaceae bacterium]